MQKAMSGIGKTTIIGLALCLYLVCTGCKIGSTTVTVDGHTFDIPNDHRIRASFYFIPTKEDDGFSFYLNPTAPVIERYIISVGPYSIMCVGRDGIPYMRSICRAPGNERFWGITGKDSLMRIPEPDYNFGYYFVRKDNPKIYIASCLDLNGPHPERGGLCNTFGDYKGIRYQVGFDEIDLPLLSKRISEINSMLKAWEQKQ
jgi:hypothetical protein